MVANGRDLRPEILTYEKSREESEPAFRSQQRLKVDAGALNVIFLADFQDTTSRSICLEERHDALNARIAALEYICHPGPTASSGKGHCPSPPQTSSPRNVNLF